MRFYKTNRADDEGIEISRDEVADRFLASEEYAEWRRDGGEILDRCVMRWTMAELGGWTDRDAYEEVLDEICTRNTLSRS